MRRLLISIFGIAVFLAASTPVSARARDDVMVGAYRCAGIDSIRIWLDCYYGAAQPVRSELGLVPAPAGQLSLGLSPPAGGERQDQGLRDEVMASAGRCGSLADERQWLDCYYAAAMPARGLLGLPMPAASPQIVAQAESKPSPGARSQRPQPICRTAGRPGHQHCLADGVLQFRSLWAFHCNSRQRPSVA